MPRQAKNPGPPPDRLVSKKGHQDTLKRLLRNEGMPPNKALLAELLSMYFDLIRDDDRDLIREIIRSTYGDPKSPRYRDRDDPPEQTTQTRGEIAQTSQIRDIMTAVLKRGETSGDSAGNA